MFIRMLSPAKINLHLRVAPPNSDGFHPLLSWMTTVGLFDRMTIHSEPSTRAGDTIAGAMKVSLTCTDPEIPCDETNLISKAARAFERRLMASKIAPPKFVSVHLEKFIPFGGGLGGGSSNAASILLALNGSHKPVLSTDDLSAAAASVGSDVAFFIHGPSSVCTGRGERVVPIEAPAPKWVVLILPGISMPTPAVYRKFDEMKLGDRKTVVTEPDWKWWTKLPARELLPLLVNDLEAPAFAIAPQLGELRQRAELTFGRIVRMSGSGSSLFTLFDEEAEAYAAAQKASEQLDVQCVPARLAPSDRES